MPSPVNELASQNKYPCHDNMDTIVEQEAQQSTVEAVLLSSLAALALTLECIVNDSARRAASIDPIKCLRAE